MEEAALGASSADSCYGKPLSDYASHSWRFQAHAQCLVAEHGLPKSQDSDQRPTFKEPCVMLLRPPGKL